MFAGPTAERIRELGLVLSAEAVQALEGLEQEHAWELLEVVKSKVEGGHIKNPSNYVCATIARGYVPQAEGGAVTASIGRAGGAPQGPSGVMVVPPRKRGFEHVPSAAVGREEEDVDYIVEGDMDDATSRLAASRGMLKAQQVGLTLSDEAVKALLQLQPDHASELLESVADKHAMLRDPSNYIAATVSRGFVPKASQLGAAHDSPAPAPSHALRPAPSVAPPSGKTSLVPPDVTPIEASVLELNAQDLWGGQQISAETLVALRCVAEDQALGLLNSLEAKGRGKGAVNINNPNNYVQAALVKIKKGLVAADHGPTAARANGAGPVSRNTTGNMSRQKARDMGLDLHDETLELLARVPLKDANWLLEAAQWVSSQEEDPNEYIQSEAANMIEAMEEAAATKKQRWS